MHGMKEIIEEAESLPIEERTVIIDSLLKTINTPIAEIDIEWIRVAKQRLSELRSDKVRTIPGDEVFARIRNRFEK
jgi:putative addiction module component (TIGR02574 family)